MVFVEDFGMVEFHDKQAENYCKREVWNLIVGIFLIYASMFIIRCFVIGGCMMSYSITYDSTGRSVSTIVKIMCEIVAKKLSGF